MIAIRRVRNSNGSSILFNYLKVNRLRKSNELIKVYGPQLQAIGVNLQNLLEVQGWVGVGRESCVTAFCVPFFCCDIIFFVFSLIHKINVTNVSL